MECTAQLTISHVYLLCSLAPLVGKVAGSQVQNIIDPLTKYVLTGDEKQRDIAAIGLKSVIGNIAPGDGFASGK